MKTYVGLAQSNNMVRDFIRNTFCPEVLISEKEFKGYCDKAVDPEEEEFVNVAGHDSKFLPMNRVNAKLEPGDQLVWAQFIGTRRNEDGSLADGQEEYVFCSAYVCPRGSF